MADPSRATGFPIPDGAFDGGAGLTKGSTSKDSYPLRELLNYLEAWIPCRGIVDAPADLASYASPEDGQIVAVRESAGAGTAPALYIYNVDAVAWQNLLSTGLPANHHATHQNGGADEVAVAAGAANAIPKATAAGVLAASWGGVALSLATLDALGVVVEPPALHRARHFNGGADELSIAPTIPAGYPYAVLATDHSIDATAGAGATVVTLPTAVGIPGRKYHVKMVATGGGTIDVTPQAGEQIDALVAGAPYVITELDQGIAVESNGVRWNVANALPHPGLHAATHQPGGADVVTVAPRAVAAFPDAVLVTDEQLDLTIGAGVDVETLPTAVGAAGRLLIFKIVATGGGNVQITPAGVEQIEGAGAGVPYVMALLNETVTLRSDNVGWEIVNAHPVPAAHGATHLNGAGDEVHEATVTVVTGVTLPYVALATDKMIRCQAGAGAEVVTLPTAVGIDGREYTVKMVVTAGGTVNVTPNGAEQIDLAGGGVPYALAALNNSVTVRSNGVGWDVVGAV